MPLPWQIENLCCYGPKGRHDGTGTATGGKVSPIDHMIDHDGPIMPREKKPSSDILARKEWRVSKSSRFGGSGLFHGGRDKE